MPDGVDQVWVAERFARKAPFPWFGGKSKAAPLVWSLLGDVDHYAEPFAGSLAVLLGRPHPCNRAYYSETVNDLDGFVANAWRSLALSPGATAEAASWPVSECDKSARQIALLRWRDEVALERLAGDPEWHDAKIAGWWLWAVAVQIGAFTGDGPWTADRVTGRIVKQARGLREPGVSRDRPELNGRGVDNQTLREPGVCRNRPEIISGGRGVNAQTLREPGVSREVPHISADGRGVNNQTLREPGVKRDRPHISNNGAAVNNQTLREPGVCDEAAYYHPTTMPKLRAWFALLSARLRHVRVLNGDWSRLCTTGALHTLMVRRGGHVGVFLDPPYADDVRVGGLYAHDSGAVTEAVRDWCVRNGDNSSRRIVLAGYDTEHVGLEAHGWSVHEWFAHDDFLSGGMGDQQHRERLWASPHCLVKARMPQMELFA
jgi:hypothetical protein